MTKPGYKQIMVPDDLHSVLKGQAATRKTSMAKLIRSLLARPVEPDARVQNAIVRESLDGGLDLSNSMGIDTAVV